MRTTTALTLAAVIGSLVACQSSPPRQRAAAIESAPAVTLPAVDLGRVVPVTILDHAAAEMGGPKVYALKLVNDASDLPGAVTGQGLDVDFASQSVVLLGMGEQPTSGYGAEITGLQRVGDTVYVQASFKRPGGLAAQVITTPWAAVTVNKLDDDTTLRSDFD